MQLERLLVNRKQLRELGVCLSFAHIDRLEKRGRFPRRIKLGNHRESRVVWRYKEVLDWIEARAAQTPPLTVNASIGISTNSTSSVDAPVSAGQTSGGALGAIL